VRKETTTALERFQDASKYVIVVVLDDFVCILFGCGDGVCK